MNRFRVLMLVFLFGSAGFCQNPHTTIFTTMDGQDVCPVEIEATWSQANARTLPANSSKSLQQTLQITLRNRQPSTVSRSVITVYGFPPGIPVTPAVLYPLGQNPLEVANSFTITRTIETGRSVSATLDIPDLAVVTGINLDSLVYADGRTFHQQDSSCQALIRGISRPSLR